VRLQEYYKFWSTVDENNYINGINEAIDLTTVVKWKGKNEWYFWVGKDYYTVNVFHKGNKVYHLSFTYNDPTGSILANITNKHTPFSVMDGVAVVMKELIETIRPKAIEYYIFAEKRKIDMFRKISKYILKKHTDVFKGYAYAERKKSLPYELPDDIDIEINGIEIRLERSKK